MADYDTHDYSDKNLRLPIVWGPSYATGVSVFGSLGKFDYAAEVKNTSLSSRPETWSIKDTDFAHPTVSTRLGFRPDEMWSFGLSGSAGSYLLPEAFLADRSQHRRLSRNCPRAGRLLRMASSAALGGDIRDTL